MTKIVATGNLQRLEYDKVVKILTFFIYSGFYLGLALMVSFGLSGSSRLFSIPLRGVLIFLMGLCLLKFYKNFKASSRPAVILLCLFSVLYFIKILYFEISSVNRLSKSWYEFIFYYASFSMLPMLTFTVIDFKKYYNIILKTLIFSGFALGIVSLYLYRAVLSLGLSRISYAKYEIDGLETISPLALAYSGVLTILLCVYKLVYDLPSNLWNKIYLSITIAVSFMLFFLGATRGSLVGLVLGVLIIIYFGSLKHKLWMLLLVIISVPALIYAAEKTGSGVFARSLSTGQSGKNEERTILYEAAYNEFSVFPIFGGRVEVSNIYPHNIWLEILMATGLVGICIFLSMMLPILLKGYNLAINDKRFIIPLLIFTIGFTMHFFSSSIVTATLFFAPLGMLLSSDISRKNDLINN